MVSKINNLLEKFHVPNWLLIVLTAVIILRIPTFFEPYSYGDQMIYLTLGEGIHKGLTLYRDIYDNKPPLLYVTAAIAGNLFWFKAILAFSAFITIIFFWKLTQALFPGRQKLHKIATIIFALLTTLPLLEGNIVNAELFMIGPIILALLNIFSKKLTPFNLIFSGMLFSFATLYKVPAAFDLPALIIFWFITSGFKKEDLKKFLKNSLLLSLGFAIPIGLTFVYFYFAGALKDYLAAAFLQNVGYLSSFRPGDVQKPFLVRNLPLLIRAGIVFLAAVSLYLARKKLSKSFIFICLWLFFGLFAVALSERPYPHYLIQVVPEIAIFSGILIADKTLEQSLAIIPLFVTFAVPVIYKFWYYPSTPYYVRFIQFATGTISKDKYFASFDKYAVRNYQIADFLVKSSRESDRVYVTGDSSVIYALSRRLPPGKYVADYHIRDYSSLAVEAELLKTEKPAFIVILPEAQPFTEIYPLLKEAYLHISDIGGAQIWALTGVFANRLQE
jgi:hypothetical protein